MRHESPTVEHTEYPLKYGTGSTQEPPAGAKFREELPDPESKERPLTLTKLKIRQGNSESTKSRVHYTYKTYVLRRTQTHGAFWRQPSVLLWGLFCGG